jgi:predicted small secreted protein
MKKLAIILAVAAGLVALAACSNTNTPEGVAKKAITALQKGDYDTYASTFDLSSSDQKWLAAMAEEKVAKEMNEKGGIKSFKVTDSTINGDSATVTVHVVYKNGEEEDQHMSYVKVDDQWKQKMNK